MGFRTIALSSSDAKKDLVLQLGAHEFIDESKQDAVAELQKFGGADVIVATVPNTAAVLKLIPGLAYGGKLLVLGLPEEAAPFTPGWLYTIFAARLSLIVPLQYI